MPSWNTGCFGSSKKSDGVFYSRNLVSNGADSQRGENFSENPKGIKLMKSFVELEKKDGMTLGLIISGGIDKYSRPKVANLRPGSIAHRSDSIAVGDFILSVNGIHTHNLTHGEIVSLLTNSGSKVTLELEYELPVSLSSGSSSMAKVIQVKLEKDKGSFGFTLRGGVCHSDSSKSSPLVITHIRFGGAADRSGIIKSGDRLIAVNGINLSSGTLFEALQFLKTIQQYALFTIEYDVSVISAVKNAVGPLLVEINKTPGCVLGINLSSIFIPEPSIVIESIRQGSIAERCGALHVGDHVLSIDDIKIDLMTSCEAMQLLRSSTGETVKLEILPVTKLSLRNTSEVYGRKSGIPNSFENPYSSISPPIGTKKGFDRGVLYSDSTDQVISCSSDGSSNSVFSEPIRIGHIDQAEVFLSVGKNGFGFHLQHTTFHSDILRFPPIVSSIDVDSTAERSGILQAGDRILFINGETTEGISLDEVMSIIENSGPHLTLITEFDVAEAVVPSTGTFVVKLAKKNADIGISLIAPINRQQGEPLIIADVKKGSISYRTGSIQPGDKLLAINSLRTENCSVDDAIAILNSISDIVKLRIKKDESFLEDPDSTTAVVYTVELSRHGGPLGITVSGTKEPFDPIYISGLTENGLAERTGALHVGDRILAINGATLQGKTLNEAICILQSCGDTVTLKISKGPLEKAEIENTNLKCSQCAFGSHPKSFTSPLSSADSAVDSWESCNAVVALDNNYSDQDILNNSTKNGNLSSSYHNVYESNDSRTVNNSMRNEKDCCFENTRPKSYGGNNLSSVNNEKDNWYKVLEDLQTCGQSSLIRQLEESILGVSNSLSTDIAIKEEKNKNIPESCCEISSQNSIEIDSKIHKFDFDLNQSKSLSTSLKSSTDNNELQHPACDKYVNDCCLYASFATPLPIEIHKVTLFKDKIYEDFGFSLSDGKYENGVFINSIRQGGPADISGLIKPLDRILQVNDIKTYNAGLIVPLIASSGDKIELVISRPAYDYESSSDDTLGRNYSCQWMDTDTIRENNAPNFCTASDSNVITKTL